MSVAKLNARRKERGLPLIRFGLRRLSEEDVQDLRDAYAAAYEISETAIGDSRGCIAVARGHGYDQDLCHSDDRVFLTWHRAYVYVMERTLNSALKWKRRDEQLELTLPFWDWTQFDPSTDAANGLPSVLNDATYTSCLLQPKLVDASGAALSKLRELALFGRGEGSTAQEQAQVSVPLDAATLARLTPKPAGIELEVFELDGSAVDDAGFLELIDSELVPRG